MHIHLWVCLHTALSVPPSPCILNSCAASCDCGMMIWLGADPFSLSKSLTFITFGGNQHLLTPFRMYAHVSTCPSPVKNSSDDCSLAVLCFRLLPAIPLLVHPSNYLILYTSFLSMVQTDQNNPIGWCDWQWLWKYALHLCSKSDAVMVLASKLLGVYGCSPNTHDVAVDSQPHDCPKIDPT